MVSHHSVLLLSIDFYRSNQNCQLDDQELCPTRIRLVKIKRYVASYATLDPILSPLLYYHSSEADWEFQIRALISDIQDTFWDVRNLQRVRGCACVWRTNSPEVIRPPSLKLYN